MTPRASVPGPIARRLAATLVVGAVCLAVGILAMPNRLAVGIAAARQEDVRCAPTATSHDCLVLGAKAALKVADFEKAEALARRAVAQAPFDADALEVLARSISPARTAALNRLTAQIARLTLQSPFSHSRLLVEASGEHRWDAMLFHADVLLRRETVVAGPLFVDMAGLLEDEAGRVALARRLATDPPWRLKFMQTVASHAKPADTIAFYLTLSRQGVALTTDEENALVNRLVDEGQFSDLRRLRAAMLPPGQRSSLVYDGEFAGLPGPASLIWQPLPLSGGAAVVGTDATTHPGALLLQHDLFSSGDWMARQMLLLTPGHYRLSLAAQGLDDQGSRGFKVGIDCRGAQNLFTLPLETSGEQWVRSTIVFTIPPEGCPAQWIAFSPVTGDRVQSVRVLIDHVAITPSAAPPTPKPQIPRLADAQ